MKHGKSNQRFMKRKLELEDRAKIAWCNNSKFGELSPRSPGSPHKASSTKDCRAPTERINQRLGLAGVFNYFVASHIPSLLRIAEPGDGSNEALTTAATFFRAGEENRTLRLCPGRGCPCHGSMTGIVRDDFAQNPFGDSANSANSNFAPSWTNHFKIIPEAVVSLGAARRGCRGSENGSALKGMSSS